MSSNNNSNNNSNNTPKYLKDYTTPDFYITKTELVFNIENISANISDHLTTIESNLQIHKNPNKKSDANLVLNGEDLKLVKISLDNQQLNQEQYQISDNTLTITSPLPDSFSLQIITEVDPKNNTSLNGLYCSNNMYCTQCESHGFRRITYYLDRPDVMSIFTTKIIADKTKYPILLSNGNLIEKKELPNNKHYALWQDPFKKPSYLFALVAGDLAVVTDTFTTMSGRTVELELYSEQNLISQCKYGLEALKDSMLWDEQKFGREYDLDLYMIVAVSDFNMGAMENKGLNVFNTKYVLADTKTATDQDYINVQAVIGHEYFHNWTGNRITCRDWFQLSLKEGLTVFRDQEFTADHHSRNVKRIDDVKIIRSAQFAEDASPMAHPIRPHSYIEMNNFYTVTVYNKGAEVIRMLHTLVGESGFRKGMDLYFKRHDGQAVTCDDFVQAISDANQVDLTLFKNWYNQAGTPTLTIKDEYIFDKSAKHPHIYKINITQNTPDSINQKNKKPFHIPIKIGLINPNNSNNSILSEQVIELTDYTQTFSFNLENLDNSKAMPKAPILSILRDFSAPVKLNFPQSQQDLLNLVQHDTNLFNQWDSLQRIWFDIFNTQIKNNKDYPEKDLGLDLGLDLDLDLDKNNLEKTLTPITTVINNILAKLIKQLSINSDNLNNLNNLDPQFYAQLLILPSQNTIAQLAPPPINPEIIHNIHQNCLQIMANHCAENLNQIILICEQNINNINKLNSNTSNNSIAPNPKAISLRSLKNTALQLLSYANTAETKPKDNFIEKIYFDANNMSDQVSALKASLTLDPNIHQLSKTCLADFIDKWGEQPLLVDKWLAVQAINQHPSTIDNIESLLNHPKFDPNNPNKIYALLAAFCGQNTAMFHHKSAKGYQVIAKEIIRLDKSNPQVAARLVRSFMSWKQYAQPYQDLMLKELKQLQINCSSKDVCEIINKSLALKN